MATYPLIPTNILNSQVWAKNVTDAINQMRAGKLNSTGQVTLEANAAETIVSDRRCGGSSVIFLTPATSNAASIISTVYVPLDQVQHSSFKIIHANNANTDKVFTYFIVG